MLPEQVLFISSLVLLGLTIGWLFWEVVFYRKVVNRAPIPPYVPCVHERIGINCLEDNNKI